MPSNALTLDANGNGDYRFPYQISDCTIINQSNASVNVQVNETGEQLLLNAGIQIQFEETEAREINALHFTNGPPNNRQIIIYWRQSTFIERYFPH